MGVVLRDKYSNFKNIKKLHILPTKQRIGYV